MSRFKERFPGRACVFIIAIHVTPDSQALVEDIARAHQGDADGVILIKEGHGTDDDVLQAYDWSRQNYPDLWIGVNLLGHFPHEAVIRVKPGTSGIWFDDPRVEEGKRNGAKYLADTRSKMEILHSPHPLPLLFPSVDFKYQPPAKNLAKVARLIEPYADAIITSGKKTGEPASNNKVKALRDAVKCPIGLASGITVENVEEYITLGVDLFIVNSSLNNEKGRLDLDKINALREKIY